MNLLLKNKINNKIKCSTNALGWVMLFGVRRSQNKLALWNGAFPKISSPWLRLVCCGCLARSLGVTIHIICGVNVHFIEMFFFA